MYFAAIYFLDAVIRNWNCDLILNQVSRFDISDAITLEGLQNLVHKAPALHVLHPVEAALDDIPALDINERETMQLQQGQSITLPPCRLEVQGNLQPPIEQVGQDYSQIAFARQGLQAVAIGKLSAGIFSPTRVFRWD